MKLLKKLPVLLTFCFLMACGGGEDTSETQETNEESNTEEITENTQENPEEIVEKFCFFKEADLREAEINLKIEGSKVVGVASYVIPKAFMSLYTNYNIEGTRDGNDLDLTFSVTDSDSGNDIGELHTENWIINGDKLVSSDEAPFLNNLQKEECSEGMSFQNEVAEIDTAPATYYYSGKIDDKLEVKMVLNRSVDPEDPKIDIIKGYYYYLSQGEDKKITLEGSINYEVVMPSFLIEVADGKEYGRFALDGLDTQLGEQINCIWVNADGDKELDVVLNPEN